MSDREHDRKREGEQKDASVKRIKNRNSCLEREGKGGKKKKECGAKGMKTKKRQVPQLSPYKKHTKRKKLLWRGNVQQKEAHNTHTVGFAETAHAKKHV